MTSVTITQTICDVCGNDVSVEVFPWPLTVTDAGDAAMDVCTPECLLLLAGRLIKDEAYAGHRMEWQSTPEGEYVGVLRWLFGRRS